MQSSDLKTSLEAANTCLGFGVRKAARVITQAYDAALAPAGLTGSQFSLMNALNLMGEPTMAQLAQAVSTDRTTLTRNLRLLEKQDWVVIAPGTDKRTRQIRLTKAGHALLEHALVRWKQVNDRVYQSFGQKNAEHLLNDLGRLGTVLEQV